MAKENIISEKLVKRLASGMCLGKK